jgi:hypothetical protein
MSGVLSAIKAAGQLFGGYGTVTLGPVKFTGLGLPESLPIGGSQALTVHKLPGGARIVDAMGQDDADISWSFILDQQDASTTARTLDKLRRSGTVITLAWDVFSYQVVVKEFRCDTRFVPPMKCQITCLVVQDNTLVSGTTLTSMALQVVQDISTGNVVGALGAVSQGIVAGPLASAASAVGATGATTFASSAYNAAVGAVNTAAGAISDATTAANGLLAPLGVSLGSISQAAGTGLSALGVAGQLSDAVSAAGDLANLSVMQGYVGRTVQNLAKASS